MWNEIKSKISTISWPHTTQQVPRFCSNMVNNILMKRVNQILNPSKSTMILTSENENQFFLSEKKKKLSNWGI